jgi:hypothetical protein
VGDGLARAFFISLLSTARTRSNLSQTGIMVGNPLHFCRRYALLFVAGVWCVVVALNASSAQLEDIYEMSLRLFQLLLLTIILVSFSLLLASGQSSNKADPLKDYTTCKASDDLKIKEVTRRNSGDKYREVTIGKDKYKVSVIDGYRVMFSYPDLPYYFANVKIERSEPGKYAEDKKILVDQLKYYSSTKDTTALIFADKAALNGFEHYGLDRDKIDVGGTLGTHLLFHDPTHLVVTVYFLNQSKAALFNRRRFDNIDEYRELRDDFLNRYSECLKLIADAQH